MPKPSKRLIFDYLPSGRNRGDRGDRRRAAAATADLQEELWKLFRRPDGIFPNVGSAAGRSLADKEDEERAARLCAPFEATCDMLADQLADAINHPSMGKSPKGAVLDFSGFISDLEPLFEDRPEAPFRGLICTMLWDRFVERVLTKLRPEDAASFTDKPSPFGRIESAHPTDESASRKLLAAYLTRRAFRAEGALRPARELDLEFWLSRCRKPELQRELVGIMLATALEMGVESALALSLPVGR